MTVEKIMIAIAQKLDQIFGNGYEVYTDAVEQDLSEPCFFIHQLDESLEQVLGNRYMHTHAFDIRYFPKNRGISEINAVSDQLYGALEYITTEEGALRGEAMKCNTTDHILHFFVDYNYFAQKQQTRNPAMQSMQENIHTKG